TNIGSITIPGS
ncbi:hypothetical protein DSL60_01275, partial [Metamycoplasma hominis]